MTKACRKFLPILFCLAMFLSIWQVSSVSAMEIMYNDGQLIIGRDPLPEGLDQSGSQAEAALPVVTLYSTITTKNAPGAGDETLYDPSLEPGFAYGGAVVSTNQTFTPYIRVIFAGPVTFTTAFYLPFPLETGFIWYIYNPVPAEVQAAPGLYKFNFIGKTKQGVSGVAVARGVCQFVMKEAPAAAE